MARTLRSRSLLGLLPAALLVLAGAMTAAGDEPQQQTPPEPTPTAVPGSLAAAAAGIRLQQPDASATGALVISDQNLKSLGAGAAVSQGSGATVAQGPEGGAPQGAVAPAPAAANDLSAQLLAQQALVDDLAVKLQSMDAQLAAPPTDPHYPKFDTAPQFRAPGVVDSARGQRDALAAQLDGERTKLEDLRAQAATAGVTLTKAPNEAPTPAS